MPGQDKDVVVVNTTERPVPTAPQGVAEVRVVNQPSEPARTPVVLQRSGHPAGFIEVRSDGSVHAADAPENVVPAGMRLVVQDVEWLYRGAKADAGRRMVARIHLGALGQGTWSFLGSAQLDSEGAAAGAHYMRAGFVVHHGEAIHAGSFVYPNNPHGDGTLEMTLRGYLTPAPRMRPR
ncbi:MAG: hypothetical protein R3A79_16640 [Nannocystaceae bacterium]